MISCREPLPLLALALLVMLIVQGASAEVPKCGKAQHGVLLLQDFIRHPVGNPVSPPALGR